MNGNNKGIILVTIFGSLSAIVASIIFSYSNIAQTYTKWSNIYINCSNNYNVLYIIIYGRDTQVIKEKYNIIKNDRLAYNFFRDFKQKRFANRFDMMIRSEDSGEHIEYSFGNIIKKLPEGKISKSEIKIAETLTKASFEYWKRRLNYFGRNKNIDRDNLLEILEEFSSMMIIYYDYCIKKSLDIINESHDINTEVLNYWNRSMSDYGRFRDNYNEFINNVNETLYAHIAGLQPPLAITERR